MQEYRISSSYEALRKDVAIYQKEYAEVLDKLSKSKKKLIDLRNHLYETEQMLKEIEDVSKESEKKIKKLRKLYARNVERNWQILFS